jgi:hypothetical protein
MQTVSSMRSAPRHDVFRAIDAAARAVAHAAPRTALPRRRAVAAAHMTEAWYCCAEPTSAEGGPDIASYV